jgi:pimeloyl-ACP methyl ester carboxylesterase
MRLVYLPGAAGNKAFWQPVAQLLADLGPYTLIGWPGLDGTPARSDVTRFSDLEGLVAGELGTGAHVIAQSMGTLVAMRAALATDTRVTSLTLVAPTGGIDTLRFGAVDWREGATEWQADAAPRYFFDERSDLSEKLPTLRCPTLVISGDRDPLSPIAVGQRFAELIPNAQHLVVPGGDHDLGNVFAELIAKNVRRFLT